MLKTKIFALLLAGIFFLSLRAEAQIPNCPDATWTPAETPWTLVTVSTSPLIQCMMKQYYCYKDDGGITEFYQRAYAFQDPACGNLAAPYMTQQVLMEWMIKHFQSTNPGVLNIPVCGPTGTPGTVLLFRVYNMICQASGPDIYGNLVVISCGGSCKCGYTACWDMSTVPKRLVWIRLTVDTPVLTCPQMNPLPPGWRQCELIYPNPCN